MHGLRGVRVGEASHPGPPRTDLRRLRTSRQGTPSPNDCVEPTVADIEASVVGSNPLPTPSTVVAFASRRWRRRLRPLPWSWDSDSELDGPAQADGDLPATVPASPRALLSVGLLPEHQFPTSGTISQSRVLSVPEDVLDALESDLAVADQDEPVEVFAMTDDASEEVEGRPLVGGEWFWFLRAPTALHIPAAARVCREAGARVSTNVLVRDLDLLPLQHADARRLEVVADGLPLYHGAQIAVDTTLVSPLRRSGTPHSRCAWEDGAALRQARRRKERVYPELSGAHGRARLVVLANEVGDASFPPATCTSEVS